MQFAARALRSELDSVDTSQSHDRAIADAARSYLDAAEAFDRARSRGLDLDAPARILESTQRRLAAELHRHAHALAGAPHYRETFNILVAVDESACAEWALAAAVKLCEAANGRLSLVHVVDPLAGAWTEVPIDTTGILESRRQEGKELLKRLADQVPEDIPCETKIVEANPVEGIVSTARRWGADFIAIGNHGRGRFARFLIGSTAEDVVRLASCPVVVVGHDPRSDDVFGALPRMSSCPETLAETSS
jgi:nucleotide-binding universal stress UspA family protein